MTPISFTPRQLDLELALVLRTLHTNLCALVGEDRAARAFDLPSDATSPEDFLPEEFPVEELPIYLVLQRVTAYVVQQIGRPQSIWLDLNALAALTYVISPELEKFWLAAAQAYPEHAQTEVTPDIDGDPDQIAGLHYRGLIKKIEAMAHARYKLDQGAPLVPGELAVLVGFNERSVTSAVSRGDIESQIQNGRRLVEAEHALEWLLARGYQPTRKEIEAEPLADGSPEERVFVPVAADGTHFAPDCRIGRTFVVGPKGREQRIEDYFQALEALSDMPVAYWRRAKPGGQWGVVRETTWHRVPLSRLKEELTKEVQP